MRLTLEESIYENIISAVKDIELASMACPETVKLLLKNNELAMQDHVYQQRDGKPLIEPVFLVESFTINPVVQMTNKVSDMLNDQNGSKNRLMMHAINPIPQGIVLLTEKPFSWFTYHTLKVCARCELSIDDGHFWPCRYCTDSVYCSRHCEQMVSAFKQSNYTMIDNYTLRH